MSPLLNSICVTGIAKTVTDVMGIAPPEHALPSIDVVVERAKEAFGQRAADRVLIYNPDAIAFWLYQKYTSLFHKALLRSDLQLPIRSVMPSVTPVCFASMYTGAMPGVHGIETYSKPVLKIDTLFDATARAGKKTALVSTAGDSVSIIFLERDIDYYIYDTAQECNRKAMELIARDEYDVICLYNPNYDITMHREGPESAEALRELEKNVGTYAAVTDAVKTHWKGHRTLMAFCTDHGCHQIDGKLGSHGLDMPEDMNVIHLFSFVK